MGFESVEVMQAGTADSSRVWTGTGVGEASSHGTSEQIRQSVNSSDQDRRGGTDRDTVDHGTRAPTGHSEDNRSTPQLLTGRKIGARLIDCFVPRSVEQSGVA